MAAANNSEDPFSILGLASPTADLKEIKRAYKRMALKFHPGTMLHGDEKQPCCYGVVVCDATVSDSRPYRF
jgi:preprotein translocase subunit Sec63